MRRILKWICCFVGSQWRCCRMGVMHFFEYREVPNNSRVSINCRVPFKRWVQVYILVNNRRFQINGESNYFFFNQGRRRDHWSCTFFFFTFFTYCAAFCQSVSHWWLPWLRCSKKIKSMTWNLNWEESSGEAAARCFSVDPNTVRNWWKNKTELQHLSEEDRARLPGGGRKKASKELEINMWEWVISKRARHERVSHKIIRAKQIYTTVNDIRDESFPPPQQLHLQKTHSCWIKPLVPNKRLVC